MQDTEQNRIAHLEAIERAIERMARNSFLLKGWAVTLVAAVLALAASDGRWEIALLALLPALIFWGLDGYYLWQERLFRCIYDRVRAEPSGTLGDEMFTMDTNAYKSWRESWIAAMGRLTVLILHGAVITAVVIAIIILATQGGTEICQPVNAACS